MISTESEFLKFAFNKYDNPHLNSIEEFEADIRRFSYINKLINRYRADKSDLQHRLITNHIIVLANCFTVQGSMLMGYYKILPENRAILETFYYYLDFIPQAKEKLDFYLLDILDE